MSINATSEAELVSDLLLKIKTTPSDTFTIRQYSSVRTSFVFSAHAQQKSISSSEKTIQAANKIILIRVLGPFFITVVVVIIVVVVVFVVVVGFNIPLDTP